MKRLFVLLLVASLLFTANVAHTVAQDTSNKDSEEYIIVYDEAHEQYFTTDLMSTALHSLNDSLDTSHTDVTVKLKSLHNQFNRTNIQGSNLVIVSNPGTDQDGNPAEVGVAESGALGNYMRTGGSVLFLSNPYSENKNITGHADPLRNLIDQTAIGADIRATDPQSPGDRDNTTIILDDTSNVNQDQYVKIDLKNINPEVIKTETQNLNSSDNPYLVYYGARIVEDNDQPADITGNTSDYAYVVDKNYEVEVFQRSPRWMYGLDLGGDGGRGMLIGSTVMFSDLPFDGTSSWINQGVNLGFFQNIVAWLLEITPIPADQPIVTEPFGFFISTNVVATLVLGLGFIILSFAYFIYRGRIKVGEVFDVFEEKRGRSKSPEKKDKPAKPKKKTTQTQRKRRRRT